MAERGSERIVLPADPIVAMTLKKQFAADLARLKAQLAGGLDSVPAPA